MGAPRLQGRLPRGSIAVTERKREAYRLVRLEGVKPAVLAERYGVLRTTVSHWVREIEEAMVDERRAREAR